MPLFPISEAAKRAKVERTTLYRKINKGEISCQLDESGNKMIEASELLRLYPKADLSESFHKKKSVIQRMLEEAYNDLNDTVAATGDQQPETYDQQQVTIHLLTNELKIRDEKIKIFEQQRERERQDARETIEDLRRRLDQETEERRLAQAKLTALLTDQREKTLQQGNPETFRARLARWVAGR